MLPFPRLHTNEPTLPAIWNTLRDIVNFLPRLEVKPDGNLVSVSQGASGQIIKVKPSASPVQMRASEEVEPAEYKYDGPWSVSIVDAQARTVAVKNGFYSVNGYIVNPTRTTHTLTIPMSDYRYVIYLEVTWNDALAQLNYEVKATSYFNSVIEGYHDNVGIQLIGDVFQSSGILKSVTNYRNALPQVMIFGAVPI